MNIKYQIPRSNRHMRSNDGFDDRPRIEKGDRHIRSNDKFEEVTQRVRIVTEPHHRRPRSLDGSSDASNISYVRPKPHRHWHTLFGNLNAMQVCELLNASPFKISGVTIECRFINGSPVTKEGGKNHSENSHKRSISWYYLFEGLTFVEIINYINNVWLDPSYHLYVIKQK